MMIKMRAFKSGAVLVVLTGIFSACSNTKYLPKGESLFVGSKVEIKDSLGLKSKTKKRLRENMQGLTRPRPDKTILGVRFKLFVYNLAGHPKKEKSPRGWLKNKVGEPPVLASSLNLERNVQVLQSYLEDRGFFKADVRGDTTIKNRKATATYTAVPGYRYTINDVIFEHDSNSAVQQAIAATAPKTLLKKNRPFNLDRIKAERERIDAALKEEGYYFFNPDFIIIWADSSIGKQKVNLYVKLKPEAPKQYTVPYTINDILIFTNYNLRGAGADTSRKNAKFYDGYYITDRQNRYAPSMLDQAMMFNTGDLYNRTDHNLSLSRLINLGVFKYVQNRFEVVSGIDSPKLNTFYYLTPFPKKSLQLQVTANTRSDNLTGSQLNVNWRNRNTFRGGELLTINAYGAFEVQVSGQNKGFNTYRAGLEGNLTFPRFLIPFFDITTKGSFLPRTNIKLGYDLLRREKLYTLTSFRGELNYIWKENIKKEHRLSPIAINYVQPASVSQLYLDSLAHNPLLQNAINKQFILGTNYNFNYNDLLSPQPASGIYFNGNLDISGNVAGLLSGADVKAGKEKQLFGAPFAQYVKMETEFRVYHKLTRRSVWANRIDIGVGLPYGNSLALPYVKQFFSGGNNSLRGFRSRSVGPGTFLPSNFGQPNTFLPDEPGDIKLELNTEYRAKLFSVIEGAVFLEGGNVWLYNNDTARPGGQFSKDFLKQLAVDAGVGLRVNASILIIRLDVGFPLRKPWLPEGHRWVIQDISFGNPAWRRENIVYNIGIGYPF